MAKAGFGELEIRSEHAITAGTWQVDHRDPFDRTLAAQSRVEQVRLNIDAATRGGRGTVELV